MHPAVSKEYDIQVQELKRTCLRSGMISSYNLGIDFDSEEEDHDSVANELVVKGSIVALLADDKDNKSFYLVKKIEEEKEKMEDIDDGFGHKVKKGMKHFEGIFLETRYDSDKQYVIPKRPRHVFFYRDCCTACGSFN